MILLPSWGCRPAACCTPSPVLSISGSSMSARSASGYQPSSAHCQNISSENYDPPSRPAPGPAQRLPLSLTSAAGRALARTLSNCDDRGVAAVVLLVVLVPVLGLLLFATAGVAAAEVLFVAGAATWVDDDEDEDPSEESTDDDPSEAGDTKAPDSRSYGEGQSRMWFGLWANLGEP